MNYPNNKFYNLCRTYNWLKLQLEICECKIPREEQKKMNERFRVPTVSNNFATKNKATTPKKSILIYFKLI